MITYNKWNRYDAKYSVTVSSRLNREYNESVTYSEWLSKRLKYVRTLSRNLDVLNCIATSDVQVSCVLHMLKYYPE